MLIPDESVNRVIYATSLRSLYSLEGEEFVACCFQVLLHRKPTAAETSLCLEAICHGAPKISLVAGLAGSEEGKAVAAAIPGLKRALRRYRNSRLPVIGCLFRFVYSITTGRKRLKQDGRVIRLSPRAEGLLNRLDMAAETYRSRKDTA